MFGTGPAGAGVTVSKLLTVVSSWPLTCGRSGVKVTCTPSGPVAAETTVAGFGEAVAGATIAGAGGLDCTLKVTVLQPFA